MPNATHQNLEIEQDLAKLPLAPIQQLRLRWRTVFRDEPPAAFGPDLLRRSIAQRMQEQHYGGLTPSARRQLDQIVKAKRTPSGRILLPKRIKPGAVLVRTWNDKSHRVMVLDDGFAYEGRSYASLSEIAREITGTRWNGPRFFGLRSKNAVGSPNANSQRASLSIAADAPKRRGRPPLVRVVIPAVGMEVDHDL
jgi:Protein of unknown function (DUF2924)